METARQYIIDNNIQYIKVGVFDLNGILRGKILSQKKFLKCLESGMGFCDVIIGLDYDDQLIDNMHFTGWHSGYPDARLRIVPETMRILPWEPESAFFLCEFEPQHNIISSRVVLRHAIEKAKSMGFQALAAMEFEFSVFQETSDSLQEKRFTHLTPLTPGNFGYSLQRSNQTQLVYDDLLKQLSEANVALECIHTEIGPGVLEAAIAYDEIMPAADKAGLFKLFTKAILHEHFLVPTFMAKCNVKQQGHGGHIHLSLYDLQKKSAFYDKNAPHHMSKIMCQFVAGQQALMPELLALSTPNVNSFARLVPGHWAPTSATWGIDNRTTALRVISGNEDAIRVEYRVPGADANPHLAMAAALISGLYGIENELKLGEPVSGNAYTQNHQALALPTTLHQAADALSQSGYAREIFGNRFIEDYCQTRHWEANSYQAAVTDWQLKRYFEVI